MNKQLIRNLLIILAISILITIVFSSNFGRGNWNLIGFLQNVLYGLIIGGSISLSGYITRFIISKSNIQKYPSRTYVLVLISIFLFISVDVIVVNLFWYKITHGYEYSEVYKSTGIVFVWWKMFKIARWKIIIKKNTPRRGIEPRPRRWERRILTTRPSGRR